MKFAERGDIKRDLFLGRFQPFHNGHSAIIKMMKQRPVVVIVKGSKTSTNKEKNPFDENYQKEMIKKVHPNIEISISPNGFLPGILGFFRKKGEEIVRIFAGSDRIGEYKAAIEAANKKMEPRYHYQVEFIETPRVTSATKVRETIRNNNKKEFQALVPQRLWSEFDTMRDKMKLQEAFTSTFREYIR